MPQNEVNVEQCHSPGREFRCAPFPPVMATLGLLMRELPRPPEIQGDRDATEMIRVWIAHEEQFVSLLLGMWADAEDCEIDEREAWGELLADTVRHVANGLNQSHGWDRDASIESIMAAFVRHIKETDPAIEGEYVEDGEKDGEV